MKRKIVEVLQAAGESLGKLKEKHGLVSEYNKRVLELEGKIKINKRVWVNVKNLGLYLETLSRRDSLKERTRRSHIYKRGPAS